MLEWLKQLFTPPPPELDDDFDWEEDVMDALKDALEAPEQRPIHKGSMIYRSKEWFEKNGLKWPD